MIKPLSTNRLIVRRFTPDDLADFLAYQSDLRVREFQHGDAMSVEQATSYLTAQSTIDERETGAWHGYAVEQRESGTVIGDIGIFLATGIEGDVGFQFHPAFHRRGYGYEAASAFLAYVFMDLGLDRVTAGCDQANAASRALLTRLGMQQRKPTGTGTDCSYELTRVQWLAES
jgi:ribosomal-protein-alanine N-acetyltransferase